MSTVVVILLYVGAASVGLALFGEGGIAAWFAVIVGGLGLNWLLKQGRDD